MKRVGLLSLGCAKNLVDSEVILGELQGQGYEVTPDADDADVVIVNTCGFIDQAKEESIDAILEMAELKKKGRLQKLIVAGCLSQRYHDEMAQEMPEVDVFLGTNAARDIATHLREGATAPVWSPDFLYSAASKRVLTTPKHSAYVKISEGCDHTCSFCIIPHLRGGHRSRSIDDICAEVTELGRNGVREINLVAQDSTYYGRDLGLKDGLAQLLTSLNDVQTVAWIRVHYMYPYQITPRLLKVMSESPRICPYIDMPLQHADARVLADMRRGSGRKQLSAFLDRIRKAMPKAFLRSSFIVGYPTEDQAAFTELVGFIEDQAFDYLGVFTYSHEEGTHAHRHQDGHSTEVKEARKETLLAIQKDISARKLNQLVGHTLDVLVEGPHPETDLLLKGRHMGQAPDVDGEVLITEGRYSAGDIIPVTVEEAFDYDLAGRVIGGMEV
ncbi:MAG: 30S ribosomal protein S12 methylthiotransferase RimO [Acidobacteria bacterium]|nr:30S ribosomal protein S12 methylthiotransferase RimO [Acidobacteriota bacterium]